MTALLNIGLVRSNSAAHKPGQPLDLMYAMRRLQEVLPDHVAGTRIGLSDTEPTLVVRLFEPASREALESLCRSLCQDCIAQYDFATGTGELVGPKADEWGPFNPEYFIGWGGYRLETAPKAA